VTTILVTCAGKTEPKAARTPPDEQFAFMVGLTTMTRRDEAVTNHFEDASQFAINSLSPRGNKKTARHNPLDLAAIHPTSTGRGAKSSQGWLLYLTWPAPTRLQKLLRHQKFEALKIRTPGGSGAFMPQRIRICKKSPPALQCPHAIERLPECSEGTRTE